MIIYIVVSHIITMCFWQSLGLQLNQMIKIRTDNLLQELLYYLTRHMSMVVGDGNIFCVTYHEFFILILLGGIICAP